MSKDPLIGRILHDTHEVVRQIGQGGMGAVYEAVHKRLRKQKFAIKVLHQKMLENETVFARFQREAEIATEIGHPNIIQVVDFYDTDEGLPCMVMEYLVGEDLGERLKRQGTLTTHEVVELVEQVGGALQAVHEKGVTHRDLKPANIFLTSRPDGTMKVKVLDFGISKIRDSGTLTGDQAVLGTPHYMSPEQGEGAVKDVDHRTDIFALGTICYQVLTGKVPFDAPTMLGVIRAICDKPQNGAACRGHQSEDPAAHGDRLHHPPPHTLDLADTPERQGAHRQPPCIGEGWHGSPAPRGGRWSHCTGAGDQGGCQQGRTGRVETEKGGSEGCPGPEETAPRRPNPRQGRGFLRPGTLQVKTEVQAEAEQEERRGRLRQPLSQASTDGKQQCT